MAFGPHITVLKDKPMAFSASEAAERDDDDDTPTYRFYESDKILGKLFRAIDENEVFADVQQMKNPRKATKSVLGGIFEYIKQNCELSLVDFYMERARGIREELVLPLLNSLSQGILLIAYDGTDMKNMFRTFRGNIVQTCLGP